MSKIIEVINDLNDVISLTPATQVEITKVETELELVLADEYKEYVGRYGAILADGVELTGVAKSKNRNVIEVTRREWELNPLVPKNMYVIENLGIDGVIIWQDSKGKIYESIPNSSVRYIAESLSEYLMKI